MLECDLRPCCIPLIRGPIVLGGTANPVKALDSKRHMPTFCDTLTPYWVFQQTPRDPAFLFFQSNFLFSQKLQVQRLLYFLFCLRKEMFLFFFPPKPFSFKLGNESDCINCYQKLKTWGKRKQLDSKT